MTLLRRTSTLVLGCALALSSLPALSPAPAGAAGPWSDPQVIAATSSPPAVTETADGTLVAITLEASGEFLRSSRAPGGDWVPGGAFTDPDGRTITYVQAFRVTPDGAGWFAYRTRNSDDVSVVRWDPSGASEQVGAISDSWTTVDMAVDADGDVLLTYGQRGGYPLSALYGNAVDGLAFLDVPSWTGGQRPHQWVLGPDDDVLLVSRFGRRLRAVDLRPGRDAKTTGLGRTGGHLTDQVVAAISPSGVQYAAWTTVREGKPRVVRLARRSPDGGWRPSRVVGLGGARSKPQKSLMVSTTSHGAYLAWVQPGSGGSKIRGALVRRGKPVKGQAVAGSRAVGDLARPRLALDVAPGGRLLIAWTRVKNGDRTAAAALGRVRGKVPVTRRLFGVDGVNVPLALLRREGQATVVGGSSATTTDGRVSLSAATD
ncbi:hypothetical protein BH09ACT12_BH09ACT12_21060 [soil metagenome]